jgi:hypothetical protein
LRTQKNHVTTISTGKPLKIHVISDIEEKILKISVTIDDLHQKNFEWKNLQEHQWQMMMAPEGLPSLTWLRLLQVPQTH